MNQVQHDVYIKEMTENGYSFYFLIALTLKWEKPHKMKNYLAPAFTIILLLSIATSSSVVAQLTPHEAISQMQKGINLGNTHEPPKEAGWNNPRAEEYYFDLYKEAGFQSVRIPVRWDNYTGNSHPYKIRESWLNRIEQVVDWGLERDLFITINSHHDDWIKDNYSEKNKERFDSIWAQISRHFKDKPEKLIFEVLNEPHGLTKAQNDDMHARILSIIRKSNPTRLVIFQGHNWGGSEELVVAAIPDDDFLIGSFHSYDPWPFGLEGTGKFGGSADYRELENKFKEVNDWSEENNIPVYLGEYGANRSGDYVSQMRLYRAYVELSQKYGFSPHAWDDGGNFRIMEREQHDWNEVKDILIHTTAKAPDPRCDVYLDSIVRVRWTNNPTDHDSLHIQRKLGTELHFKTIATLQPDTTSYFDVKPTMSKNHDYRVIAHYNDTAAIYSQPFRVFFPIWTKPVRKPFYDTLMVIPGIIEAEDFDYGGEGLSYHETDNSNIAGDYRPNEAVDIYDRLGDGYHIGNTVTGEWYEYSVNVVTEGWYDITVNIASLFGGGTFQLMVDTVVSEIITAPNSSSALNTKPVTTRMYLHPGEQIVRFTVISEPGFNIDNMQFELVTGISQKNHATKNSIQIYQNNMQQLTIRNKQNKTIESVRLYSISGEIVLVTNPYNSEIKIRTNSLHEGVYIVYVVSEGNSTATKVFIQNQ